MATGTPRNSGFARSPASGTAGSRKAGTRKAGTRKVGSGVRALLPAVCACWLAWTAFAQGTAAQAPAHQAPAPRPIVGTGGDGGAWSAQVKAKATAAASAKTAATAIRITGDDGRTRVRVDVTRPIMASLFTLDAPYRAIIDVADLEFQLPAGVGARGRGIVKAFRYGEFQAGRSRVVIDLAGPAKIENAALTPATDKAPGALVFDLVRISAAEFTSIVGGGSGAGEAADQKLRGAAHDELPAPQAAAPARGTRQRPVIVIDPGHGGIDPGTVASPQLTEKMVTLAVARELQALLARGHRYDVHMTRQGDTFLSLDQRVRISRQHVADLFISIHADALAETNLAQAVRGATVYVLADRASDEAARRLAEKENAADVLAGLAAMPASVEDQVRNILLDLVHRETANFSATFRGMLVSHMRGKVPLAKDPQRSAAFKVLKQPDTPSVLVELGYMSNSEDLARLSRPDGQRQLAASLAAAVDAFFAKRDAKLNR